MGIENYQPTSTPDILNVQWPEASDSPSEGDNHLRGVKQVVLNAFTAQGTISDRVKVLEDKAYLALGPEQASARNENFEEAFNSIPPDCVVTRSDTFITDGLTEYVVYYRSVS